MTSVLLLSTFELGRQPFGVAHAAACLREAGAAVAVRDLALDALDEAEVREAELIAFSVPMHTATRLALEVLPRVRQLAPRATIGFFGLYAPLHESLLREAGADIVLGGESEQLLVEAYATRRQPEARVSLEKLRFRLPDRSALPPLTRYAKLREPGGSERTVAYVEASRGCKHLCRHCPVVPVYGGVFRAVDRDVVLRDIEQQIAAGARHVTFGDADFFNAPSHALRIVRELCARWPGTSYDATIKVEHLRRHERLLGELVATGCAFVTTAVESIDDTVLAKLAKGHTRADVEHVLAYCRGIELALAPTFVAFTPWTTLASYLELLAFVDAHDLAGAVPAVQLTIRLLVPLGSRLLELDELRAQLGAFDTARLSYPWRSADARVDALQRELEARAASAELRRMPRAAAFAELHRIARAAAGSVAPPAVPRRSEASIPFMTEPWY